MIDWIKRRIDARLREMVRAEVELERSKLWSLVPQLVEAANSPPERKQSFHDRSRTPDDFAYFLGVRNELASLGVHVEDVGVDFEGFELWLAEHPEMAANYAGLGELRVEKCLEHYLTFSLLRLVPGDVFIDVAAAGSPYVDFLNRRTGITSYRLDLSYPQGIHGPDIGADAGATGLPAGFASALALHCAFECFMGDDDRRFIAEAARLLKPGGRLAIVPLYLDTTFFNATSPLCDQREVRIDQGALRLWRDDPYQVPFSRHYSPAAFYQRVYSELPRELNAKVLFFRDMPELMRRYPGQRAYCYFMLYCEKIVARQREGEGGT